MLKGLDCLYVSSQDANTPQDYMLGLLDKLQILSSQGFRFS